MRHLKKIKPSGLGLGYALSNKPQGASVYYPMQSNVYVHQDDFPDTVIDTAEWADDSTLGTGGAAAITYGSSFAILDTSTGTAGTSTQRLRSATSSNGNIYNVPVRVTWWARISTTAGAGVAPTGGLDVYFALRNSAFNGATDDSHIAQFHLDFSTAGASSLASPVVNVETRQGTTGANFINSAAHNIFNSAVGGMARTCTSITGYVIEITHRGVSFGTREQDPDGITPPQLLSYFGTRVPRIDQNYYIDTRIVADGTAGFTQTDGVQLELDRITVEQMAPNIQPMAYAAESVAAQGGIRSYVAFQTLASNAVALVTSGSGLFYGFGFGATATAGAQAFITAYDASGTGSAVYDFSTTMAASAGSRIIWHTATKVENSAAVSSTTQLSPPVPIPFFRGLVVGSTTISGSAAGGTGVTLCAVFGSQR